MRGIIATIRGIGQYPPEYTAAQSLDSLVASSVTSTLAKPLLGGASSRFCEIHPTPSESQRLPKDILAIEQSVKALPNIADWFANIPLEPLISNSTQSESKIPISEKGQEFLLLLDQIKLNYKSRNSQKIKKQYTKFCKALKTLENYLKATNSFIESINKSNYDGSILPELKTDKVVVMAAVRQHGYALRHASPELREDKEVVMAAVRQNGDVLEFASQELKADAR